jgi:hypothetical protein
MWLRRHLGSMLRAGLSNSPVAHLAACRRGVSGTSREPPIMPPFVASSYRFACCRSAASNPVGADWSPVRNPPGWVTAAAIESTRFALRPLGVSGRGGAAARVASSTRKRPKPPHWPRVGAWELADHGALSSPGWHAAEHDAA